MLPMTDQALAALTGTRTREQVTVSAYLGQTLTGAFLPVTSWSLTWDASREVHCHGTVTVSDPDGALAPWVLGDTLAPGARLQVTWVCDDGSTVPRALLVVSRVTPETAWRIHPGGGTERWVPAGGTVVCDVEGIDLLAQRDRLQAKDSPQTGTVVAEVTRLLGRILPVVDDSGGDTTPVAEGTVYERERLAAVDDLLDHAGLARRTDGAGVTHILDPGAAAPVWAVEGGQDRAALVALGRSMRLDDVYNSVVASSSGGADEHVGRAYLPEGVASWNGPLGNCTLFYASPLITSQESATRAAATRLRNLTEGQEITLSVTCLPHPGLEVHDRVTVMVPTRSGAAHPVVGRVQTMTLGGDAQGLNPMVMDVVVPRDDLADVIRGDRSSQ